MSFSVHLKALLWREAMLVRQSKLFAVLQLLVSCVLLACAAVSLSTVIRSQQPDRWVFPSWMDADVDCRRFDFFIATPTAYTANITTLFHFMNNSDYPYPYSPGMRYPTDIYSAELLVNASTYASINDLQAPYITHIAPDEGTATVFFTPVPGVTVDMSNMVCVPYFLPLSFDAAAVPALQPLTTIRKTYTSVVVSMLPMLAVLSSMAVIAAMLPAVAGLAVRLTDDKTSRLREHLKIMGMHNTAYYAALHAACAARIVPVALAATVVVVSVAPELLSPTRAVAYFLCAAVGGVSIGPWIHPVGLSLRRPMLTTTAACLAVLCSAATVLGAFMSTYVPQGAQWPLLLLFGPPAATVAALAGLVLEPLGGIGAVSPMASMAAAVLSGLLWGAVGEYGHARNPGEYGVPQPAGYPLLALRRLIQARRTPRVLAGEKAALLDSEAIAGRDGEPGPAVEIRNLWKVFGEEEAVSGLDLDVRYGEILALLGHNGAGKSTTVSVLTGMLPATRSECCKVGGRDVALDIDGVREVIGVCPQVDILMPDLSATEHVRFFGALRGVDNRERGVELLRTLDLPLNNQKAGTFSGGMKRRLSLTLALCTDSPVLFLDEPSSGLDPVHRRKVWDLLRRKRAEGRGIILTTHFMEEAEVLGDRVAIMAKGRLRCCDTTAALKARFSVGDRLHLAGAHFLEGGQREGAPAAEGARALDVEGITRLVHAHLPLATVEERCGPAQGGQAVMVTVPRPVRQNDDAAEALDRLAAVLSAIEKVPALGVARCTIAQTTIEEVFLRIADQSDEGDGDTERDTGDGKEKGPAKEGPYATRSSISMPESKSILEVDPCSALKCAAMARGDLMPFVLTDGVTTAADLLLHAGGGLSPLRTFAALWRMRIALLLRGTWGLPLLLPLLIAGGALASLSSTETPTINYVSPSINVERRAAYLSSWAALNDTVRTEDVRAEEPFSHVSPVLNQYAYAGTIGLIYDEDACAAGTVADFADRLHWCLQAAVAPGNSVPPLHVVARRAVLQGQYPLPAGSVVPTQWVPSVVFLDAMNVTVNDSASSHFNIRLAPSTDFSNFQWNDPFGALVPLCAQRAFSTMVAALAVGHSALPLRFGSLPTAPPAPPSPPSPTFSLYTWINVRSYTILPFAIMCPLVGLTATSAALPMLADLLDRAIYAKLRLHGAPARLFWLAISAADASVVLPALAVLLIAPYAMAIPELSGPGIFFMCAFAIAGVFAFNNLIASVLVLSLPRHLPMAVYVGIFACTSFVLTAAFASPHLIAPSAAKQIFGMLNIGAALTTTLTESRSVPATAAAVGAAFSVTTLVALAMRFVLEPVWTALWTRPLVGGADAEAGDADVRAEAGAVLVWRQGAGGSVRIVAALVEAWRIFNRPPLQAVRGVSCGVRLGECFGLLGPNGAGKTTAVGLLTAQDGATGGEVCVGDSSGQVPVHSYAPASSRLASQEALHAALPMGLCGQHDTLFPTMTAEQHLLFYLSLRAVGPWRPALWEGYVAEVLRRVGLGDVLGTAKRAAAYSGGMKRKLQVAIAMYTGGRLCVLDEPSTGMDPGARRLLWAAIHGALEGGERSVLLTTHSMEEAENACTRLAIMQHGQLRCIGTPDHLRALYGDGYTMTVGMPAGRCDADGIAALNAAVAEALDDIRGAARPPTDDDKTGESRASAAMPPRDAAPPADVLGGRVLVYKMGRPASLSNAYAVLAGLQRRFPAVTLSLAQNTSLEQIFISIVGRGGRS